MIGINMKKLVYSVTDPTNRVTCITLDSQEGIDNVKNDDYTIDVSLIDMDKVSRNAWDRLSSLEKLALSQVDCVLWAGNRVKT